MTNILKRFGRSKTGATGIEYGIIAAFVAITIVASVTIIATETGSSFSNVADGIGNAAP